MSTAKIKSLVEDVHSIPGDNWRPFECEHERGPFSTHAAGENEVQEMMSRSDTCVSSGGEVKALPRLRKKHVNLNRMNADSNRNNLNDMIILVSILRTLFVNRKSNFDFRFTAGRKCQQWSTYNFGCYPTSASCPTATSKTNCLSAYNDSSATATNLLFASTATAAAATTTLFFVATTAAANHTSSTVV